jgi:hypothetical protein
MIIWDPDEGLINDELRIFIPVIALLTGTPSRESPASVQRWLDRRATKDEP